MAKVTSTLNVLLKAVSTVLVIALVALAVALVGVRVFGLQVYSVLSGSMEPAYKTGAIVYVKDVDPATLVVGDPVTFELSSGTAATHRIVELVPDENDPSVTLFRTKGDANEHVDAALVSYGEVIGKPIFTIPYLGYLAEFIQSKTGRYICIVAAAVVVLLTVLSEILDDGKSEKKKKKKKGTDNSDEDEESEPSEDTESKEE